MRDATVWRVVALVPEIAAVLWAGVGTWRVAAGQYRDRNVLDQVLLEHFERDDVFLNIHFRNKKIAEKILI